MKYIHLLFLFLFLQIDLSAQCNFPLPPSNTCENAPLLCDLDEYCSSSAGFGDSGTPNAFCGQVENNCWLTFIAGSEVMEIEITVNNCNQGSGVQAQIFETSDCNDFTAVSNCLDPVSNVAILLAENLVIGNLYYVMIDGKGGDFCDFSFDVLNGFALSPAESNAGLDDFICGDETYQIDASASANGLNLTYQWTATNGGNIVSGETTLEPIVDTEGTYELIVVDLLLGCADTSSIVLIDANLPIIDIQTPAIIDCVLNQTVTLDANNSSSFGNEISFLWTTTNGNIIADEMTATPTVDMAAWYLLEVMDLTTGCTDTMGVEVLRDIETPSASVNVSEELNCITESLIVNGIGSSFGNNFVYEWSTTTGNIIGSTEGFDIRVDAPGFYTLAISNIVNGCIDTDSVEVTLNEEEPSSVDFTIQNPCYGEDGGLIQIDAVNGGIPPYQFHSEDSLVLLGNKYNNLLAGVYELTIQDATGCEWDTVIILEEVQELRVELGKDIYLQLGDSTELEALINFPISSLDTVVWWPDIFLTCDGCMIQSITPLKTFLYTVDVYDENTCHANDSIYIHVIKDRLIFIPNAFSPNGDGINEKFLIHGGTGVVEVKKFQIFDRWGENLFSANNFQPNDTSFGWDGTFKGKPLQNSVFVYLAEVEFTDGYVKQYSGDVLLMR